MRFKKVVKKLNPFKTKEEVEKLKREDLVVKVHDKIQKLLYTEYSMMKITMLLIKYCGDRPQDVNNLLDIVEKEFEQIHQILKAKENAKKENK